MMTATPTTLTEHEILSSALDWRAAGRRVAVCTVVETWGSAPKPVGSHLIVDAEAAFVGSVSGGCIEGDVVTEAVDAIETGKPRVLDFGVTDERAWTAGLTCGGRIAISVAPLDDSLAARLTQMVDACAAGRPTVLVSSLDGGPPEVATRGEHTAHRLTAEIGEAFRTGKSRRVDEGKSFLTTLMPATRLVVFGAVHIAQALVPIAKLADLDVTIVDPRSAFATPERFPDVRLLADWPVDAAETIGLRPSDAVAALCHDPKIDDQGLQLALAAGCFYVGALGSQRSQAKRLDRLRAAGIGEPDLSRIHAPIGLSIGAQGPAEIAVSILAEIISVRRGTPFAASVAA